MKQSLSDRRLAENEVVFRAYNERLTADLDRARSQAAAGGYAHKGPSVAVELQFYCECSDENCRRYITMPADRYADIHVQRDIFIVLPGHEVPRVERFVTAQPGYTIVEKYKKPAESVRRLHRTEANNV